MSEELEAAKERFAAYRCRNAACRICPYVSLLERELEAREARPESVERHDEGFPKLGGVCPFCGATMFLAVGGWPTCSYVECPNPTGVADLLTDRRLRIVNCDTQAAERKNAEMAEARADRFETEAVVQQNAHAKAEAECVRLRDLAASRDLMLTERDRSIGDFVAEVKSLRATIEEMRGRCLPEGAKLTDAGGAYRGGGEVLARNGDDELWWPASAMKHIPVGLTVVARRVPAAPKTEMVAAKDVRPGMVLTDDVDGPQPVASVTHRTTRIGEWFTFVSGTGTELYRNRLPDELIEVVVPSDGEADR